MRCVDGRDPVDESEAERAAEAVVANGAEKGVLRGERRIHAEHLVEVDHQG